MDLDGPLPWLQVVRLGKGPILVGDENVIFCIVMKKPLNHSATKRHARERTGEKSDRDRAPPKHWTEEPAE